MEARLSRTPCERVQSRLAALTDGGLPPLEAARDRGHLEACEPCRREENELVRLVAAIRVLGTRSGAEDARLVAQAVLRRLPPPRSRVPSRSRARVRELAGLAAAAVLVLAGALRVAGTSWMPTLPGRSGLEHVIERVPSWATLQRGLEQLSRWVS